jgi:predicted nucleic acid-binding protein
MTERPGARAAADPTRVVADADVLAADLLCGGTARAGLDLVREHSWVTLVASDPLLEDAASTIADLADDALAADWRERVETEREPVTHADGDHPGLGSAAAGGAAHLLTLDDDLVGPGANLAVQPHLRVSIRTPRAFAASFDAETLYAATHDGDYPGPDRDPRG